MAFAEVLARPLTRSSYLAGEQASTARPLSPAAETTA